MDCKLIIFTKPYNSPEAKTRLRKAGLADEFVNKLHNKLLEHTLVVAESLRASNTAVYYYGSEEDNFNDSGNYLPSSFEYHFQKGNDFSSRLQNCWDESTKSSSLPTILIGSDCPSISLASLNQAVSIVDSGKACIGPTPDNGFYLIGLPSDSLEIDFEAIIAAENQIEAASQTIQLDLQILAVLRDIDRTEDIISCLF